MDGPNLAVLHRMKFLISCLCAALPLWAADNGDTWCEHRLMAVAQAPRFFASFHDILESGAAELEARVHRQATGIGARRFGVHNAKAPLTLSLLASDSDRDNIVIELNSEGKIVYKTIVKLPPLYVWTREDDRDSVTFPQSTAESPGSRIGLVLERSFQSRRFIEIKYDQTEQKKIVMGLDVDCAFARNYSSISRRLVMFNEKYYLCRVPLIEASL